MISKKTILLYPSGKWHSLYNPLIKTLSKKYNLIYNPRESKIKQKILAFLYGFKGLRIFYHKFIRNYINLHKISKTDKPTQEYDLVYASNSLPPFKCNFIMGLEIVSALAGYNFSGLKRQEIKKRLEDPSCKKIICWNKSSYLTLTRTIDCSKFLNKIKIIPFGLASKKINKKIHPENINFLFVSSINNPQDFELKGGLITLESFSKISAHYPNSKLYVRSLIPQKIKRKYEKNDKIIFLENFLSNEEMDKLFSDTDILLEPVPGINLMLDCMNYKIPIIAFDYWVIPEMVHEGKNGLLVSSNNLFGDIKDTENYLKNLHLKYLKLLNPRVCLPFADSFFRKSVKLIENKSLRLKMGRYGKMLLENGGPYSLKSYNRTIFNLIKDAL